MSTLETAYAEGQLAALRKLGMVQPSLGSVGIKSPVKAPSLPTAAPMPKIPGASGGAAKLPMPSLNTNPAPSLGQQAAKLAAPSPTHAAVRSSPLLGGKAPETPVVTPAPTNPQTVKAVFDVHEQSKTRLEPVKKLSAEICTTCRRPKHYGPCPKPTKTKPAGTPIKWANFNFGMHGADATSERSSTSGRYNASTVKEEPSRSFGRVHSAIPNTDSVSIDQLGHLPDGEPAVLG